MIADNTAQDIHSIEELTIVSLDKSQEGLDDLLNDVHKCAEALKSEPTKESIQSLSLLAEHLHDFDIFEHDVCSLFEIDRSQFKDSKGSLESNAERFRSALNEFSAKLEKGDFEALSILFSHDLSDSLARFKELMPLVKTYVEEEYVQGEMVDGKIR